MEPDNLWKEYLSKRDPEIKEEIIIHYVSLVKKIAKKMAYALPAHIDSEDLYSYGIFGLLEAIDRYNPELGIPFTGFAVKRIKGSIIDEMRKEDWIPVSVRKKAKLLEQAYQKVEMQLGRNAVDNEIASELRISLTELSQWLNTVQYVTLISLDESLSDEETISLIDNLPNWESPNPLFITEEKEIKTMLAKTISELPEKEKLVISFYYFHELTNKEIAQVMELSESRISQLHAKAIFRLRGKLARHKKYLR